MPFIQAMASQQNTFLSLLLLTGTAWFWRRGQGLRAGLVAGLLLFKPQLAAVVAAALCCSLGRRALLGLAATASALLVATVLVMPGALADYLDKLPSVLPWLKSGGHYAWERQVTFQGFWRLLIQGPVSGPAPAVARLLWPGCAVAAGAMLVPAFIRAWRTRPAPGASHDRLIAATVAMTPLLMPYYMDYDLLLLAVPAVLLAAEWRRSAGPPDWTSRLLLRGWVLLFPLLFLNAAFAEATRVSLTVPLLAGMAGLYAWRAARPAVAQGAIRLQMPQRPEFPVPQGQPAAA